MGDKDQNTTSTAQYVQLSPVTPIVAQEPVCAQADTGCSSETEYEDIIYVPMMRKFWIIPKHIANELEEAAVTLFNNGKSVATTSPEDKTALMEALDISHLMKFFYSPNAFSFLSGEDFAAYQESKELNEEAQQQINDGFGYSKPPIGSKAANRYPGGKTNIFIRWHTQEQINALEKKGRKLAEAQGYEIDKNGEIFTPEQILLRDMLLAYAKNSDIIAKNERLTGEMQTVFDKINQLRKQYENLDPDVDGAAVMHMLYRGYTNLDNTVKEQIKLILQLGTIGIATPELALGHHNNIANLKEGDLVTQGMHRVYFMRRRQAARGGLIDEIGDLFSDWQFFLGNRSSVNLPVTPFTEKLLELIKLDQSIEQYIIDAEEASNKFVPRKILVWDPRNYQYKGTDALLSAPMPLREFTRAPAIKKIDVDGNSKFKELYQFSIIDLAKKVEGAPNFVKKAADFFSEEKGYKAQITNLNNNNDELFELYLKERGAILLEINSTWYDANKVFDPNKLYAEVEKYNIRSLQNEADKQAWGELLKYTIFEVDFLKRIMGFDPSCGAQLVRLLSKYTKDYVPFMEYAANSSGKAPSLPTFSLGGVEAKIVASPLHGRVVSDPFCWPKPKDAINPKFTFKHFSSNEPVEVNFGYFFFKTTLTAWGFSGACLALAGNVSLYANHGNFGVTVEGGVEELPPPTEGESDEKPAAAKGPVASIGGELFVGAQAGIGGTVEVKWCPPKGTKGHFWLNLERTLRQMQGDTTITGNINSALDHTKESNYKTLLKTTLGGAGMVGFGAVAELGITINKDKIRIRIAYGKAVYVGAKIIFEFDLDPSAAVDIIRILLQAIRDNDNRPIGLQQDNLQQDAETFRETPWHSYDDQGELIISETFYNYLTKLLIVGRTYMSLAYATTVGISKLETLYKSLTADFGVLVAHLGNTSDPRTVDELEAWFAELPPQTIGALLYHISKDMAGSNSWSSYVNLEDSDRYTTGQLIAYQQRAIANCVKWLLQRKGATETDNQPYPNTAQTIFGEAVLRMNAEGTNATLTRYYAQNPNKNQVWAEDIDKTNYRDNIKRLRDAMKREVTNSNTGDAIEGFDILNRISKKAKEDFNEEFDKLTRYAGSGAFNVTQFIQQQQQRLVALNKTGGSDVQTA